MAAQGSFVVYVAIIWFYANYMNKLDRSTASPRRNDMAGLSFEPRRRRLQQGGQCGLQEGAEQGLRLVHRRLRFTFVIVLAIAEQMGLSRGAIGIVFLLATVALYAGIGIMSRTNDAAEYYVAGRRVPAVYNGMATGADWMSAASFIGMAGTLYLTGYGGLAFIMGWTGGYCLVALFLAPYLRKFGQFTIPDFLGARYEGNAALCRHPDRHPVLLRVRGGADLRRGPDHHPPVGPGVRGRHLRRPGRHPGVLVPGRHARRHLDAGGAVHHPDHRLHDPGGVAVGEADRRADSAGDLRYQLEKVTAKEKQLIDDPKEKEVIAIFKAQSDDLAAKLKDVPAALAADKAAAQKKIDDLKAASAPLADVQAAEKALAAVPKDEDAAKRPGRPPRRLPTVARGRWPACPATRSSTRAIRMVMRQAQKTFNESGATSWPWCSA
jgi:cation/acetate symporter